MSESIIIYHSSVLPILTEYYESKDDKKEVGVEGWRMCKFKSSNQVLRFCQCKCNHYDNGHHDHTGTLPVSEK